MPSWTPLLIVFCVLVITAVVTCGYFYFRATERPLRIREFSWIRTIEVEAYKTVHEEGWQVPEGGRVASERLALHHTDRVLDGSELKYGYDFFSGKWKWRSVPKYKDVPVYKTKYSFNVERWVHERIERANGNDHNPHWPAVTLGEHQREGMRTESYTTIFEDVVKDPSRTYARSYELSAWQALDERGLYVGTFDSSDKLLEVKMLELEQR